MKPYFHDLYTSCHRHCARYSTYSKPLRIIRLPGREQRMERVVRREREASGVDEELAGDVEEDEEEVEGAEAEDDVDLGHARLLLEILQSWVL